MTTSSRSLTTTHTSNYNYITHPKSAAIIEAKSNEQNYKLSQLENDTLLIVGCALVAIILASVFLLIMVSSIFFVS